MLPGGGFAIRDGPAPVGKGFSSLSTRTNADPAELKPRLAAALVVAAIHTAVQYWLDNPTVGTLRDALTASMQEFHLEKH